MKKKLILGLMIFIYSLANAQEDRNNYQFTLEDCLNYAFNNNYTLQTYDLSKESAEAGYRQSQQLRLPSVNANLGETFTHYNKVTDEITSNKNSWNGSATLSADMVLFQGGSITTQIAQSKLVTEQTEYQANQYLNTLTIDILQAFLTVLSNEELLKNQEVLIKTTEEQMNQGKAQYEAGQILESDYLLLRAQYANDLSNITDSRINRDNSILALKILMSMNPLDDLHIIYPDTTAMEQLSVLPTLEYVIEQSIQTLPDLKLSQTNIDMAELNIKSAQSSYFPTLSLSAGIGTGHNPNFQNFGNQVSNRLNENVSLSLRIPIYNNSKTKTLVYQNRIALEQSELDYQQAELNIIQVVTQNYQNVVSAYNKFDASETREHAYLESFNAYNAMFNAGSITVVELLQQQNNYLNALNDFIQSKYSFLLRRKLLDVYMGIPISM